MAESKPVVVSKVGFPLKKGEIRIEVGETSQCRDQLVISADLEAQTQSDLSKEDWFKMFYEEEEINEVPTISKTPQIQKVIFLLRDHKHFVKYYEPRMVSFGPIHHGKEKYQLAEKFKRILAREFVKRSGKTIKEICEAIDGKIKELRECFEEEVTKKYNDVDLAWILVVDGCAILQYIYIAVEDKFKELNIKPDSVAFCQQDLFLLENQVPYDLLELLMSLSNAKNELRNSVQKFIKKNHYMVLSDKQQGKNTNGPVPENPQEENGKRKPTHLLDLLRSSLLGLARKLKKGQRRSRVWKQHKNYLYWQRYRSIRELIAAGIHVKRSEDNFLRGISFTRKFNFLSGILWLPPLIVDDSTGPMFLNLIAYEKCLDFQNDFGITSYISFLDSLIDEGNDVKELRKAGVLINLVGSDEEVAQLFNEIGTDLVSNIGQYEDVKWQIQEYFDNKIMVWMAELLHDIFSRPWKIVAFFGSLSALVLTATQTLYSPSGPCDDFCKKFT